MYLRDPLPALSTRLHAALGEVAARFIEDEDVPGASLAIVRDGRAASAHAGMADISAGQPADDRTLYRIASISKTFTAWGVLALRDAGQLSLDDSVVDHIREFALVRDPFGPIDRVTVRMLLQHASGLQSEPPGETLMPWRPLSIEETLSRLDRTAVVIPPGSAYKYSNVGYDVLGELIRRVSGVAYATYLERHVLEPLGMRATTLHPSPDQTRAIGFDPRVPGDPGAPREPWLPATDHGPGVGEASGGWWSCIGDLVIWSTAQLGPVVARMPVSAVSLKEMHTPAFSTEDNGGTYGLGWRVARRDGRTILGHGGMTYGFEAIIGLDRDTRTAAVALANGIPSPGAMQDLRDRLLDLASDRPAATAPELGPRPAGDARSARAGAPGLVGSFREVGFRNDVTIARGPVLIEAGGRRRALLATSDPHRFIVGDGRAIGESLCLLRDDSGEVVAIELGGYYFKRILEASSSKSSSPRARKEAP